MAKILKGNPVAAGVAVGPAHLKGYDLEAVALRRVPKAQVDDELNRFRKALEDSRKQLKGLTKTVEKKVSEEDARIFGAHLAYLKDPVFIGDVENLILSERRNVEWAIAKVVSDFDRIFKLVESETLRERAMDLRDVGVRVLRNVEEPDDDAQAPPAPRRYVLVARELSIADMFNLRNERVEGIITETGGITSHAAILARTMGIPTVTGISDLWSKVEEGARVLVDGSTGQIEVGVNDTRVAEVRQEQKSSKPGKGEPEWVGGEDRTADGTVIEVLATCGNPAEVSQACRYRMDAIGLYRSELPYLVGPEPPAEDSALDHYRGVVDRAEGRLVTFRLLDLDAAVRLPFLFPRREPNPALGIKSIRALRDHPALLREQVRAFLRAGAEGPIRILIPFVSSPEEFAEFRAVIREESRALDQAGVPHVDEVAVGASIELPSAALAARALVRRADFVVLALDNFLMYLFGADRSYERARTLLAERPATFLRAVRKILEVGEGAGCEVTLAGEMIGRAETLAVLVGLGARRLSVSPGAYRPLREHLADLRLADCQRKAVMAMRFEGDSG